MKITLDLPDDLVRAGEAEAKQRGCTLSDIVVEGLELMLAERAGGTRRTGKGAGGKTGNP